MLREGCLGEVAFNAGEGPARRFSICWGIYRETASFYAHGQSSQKQYEYEMLDITHKGRKLV